MEFQAWAGVPNCLGPGFGTAPGRDETERDADEIQDQGVAQEEWKSEASRCGSR